MPEVETKTIYVEYNVNEFSIETIVDLFNTRIKKLVAEQLKMDQSVKSFSLEHLNNGRIGVKVKVNL